MASLTSLSLKLSPILNQKHRGEANHRTGPQGVCGRKDLQVILLLPSLSWSFLERQSRISSGDSGLNKEKLK
jgi:hypothetical protein